jgi:DHA2 family multidrug resistance protein-like MFS transporter
LKEVAKPDFDPAHALVAGAIGVVFMVWFVRRQTRATMPLVDFSLYRNPLFLAGTVAIIVSMIALMGVQIVLTQRLQLVAGLSPLQAGLFIIPISAASFLSGPIFGSMLYRIGIARGIWISLLIGAVGLAGFVLFSDGPLFLQIFSFALFGFGGGATMSVSSTAIMVNAPDEKAGMAASLESVSYEMGGVLGVAIMGSVATYFYTSTLFVPPGIAERALAKDGLDQALLLAEAIGGEQARILAGNARAAFNNAYLAVVVLGGLLMALLSAVIAASPSGSPAALSDGAQH